VSITPENQQETAQAGSSETIRRPSLRINEEEEMVRAPWRHGEVGRNDRSHQPGGNRISEIPCRVSNDLPLERAISLANPANNGEPLPLSERGIPWEVESSLLSDPVTTEAKAEMEFHAVDSKSTDSIRRRPSKARIDIPSYISSYVDGEGCFCVSFRPQPRILIGWEVRPSFSVSQNDGRAEVIRLLPHLFGCGSIRPDRSDKTVKFEVRSIGDLTERVIPFFEEYPLLSSKRDDFQIFSEICGLVRTRAHLRKDGMIEIVELAERMNSSVIRRYSAGMIKASLER
jgi:hypothetical protein